MSPDAQAYIKLIKAQGYRVFMYPHCDTYCYYTDGTRIGYAQWSRMEKVTTVHQPSVSGGTGYVLADEITPESLDRAIKTGVPEWSRDGYPKKYKDWEQFFNANAFNKQLVEM